MREPWFEHMGGSVITSPAAVASGEWRWIYDPTNPYAPPRRETQAEVAKRYDAARRLRRGLKVRASWTPEMLADEAERLAIEIADFLAARDQAAADYRLAA